MASRAIPEPPRVPDANLMASLTKREKLIVSFVAKGLTDEEVAATLAKSVHTIRVHVKRVYLKLNVNRRVVLARWAWEAGLSA